MGWVALYSPDTGANVQFVTCDETAPEDSDSVITVHTDDAGGAYEEAQRLGYEIVYPIAADGVCRFFVRAPDGNAINIVNDRDRNSGEACN